MDLRGSSRAQQGDWSQHKTKAFLIGSHANQLISRSTNHRWWRKRSRWTSPIDGATSTDPTIPLDDPSSRSQPLWLTPPLCHPHPTHIPPLTPWILISQHRSRVLFTAAPLLVSPIPVTRCRVYLRTIPVIQIQKPIPGGSLKDRPVAEESFRLLKSRQKILKDPERIPRNAEGYRRISNNPWESSKVPGGSLKESRKDPKRVFWPIFRILFGIFNPNSKSLKVIEESPNDPEK